MFAKSRYIYTASAYRNLSVFHNHALMTRCRETVFNNIRKSTFEVEYRCSFFHHLFYRIAAFCLFCFAQSQFLCVWIRCMEIERYCTNILRITGCCSYIPDTFLVDLIYSHVETDIVISGAADVFHDRIVCVTTDLIMTLLVSVKT